MKVSHKLKPIFHRDSEILILGTMPSVLSRKTGFYYGHPRNRFWLVLSDVFQEKTPKTITEKKVFLRKHRIALWDVLKECDITASNDNSIRNPIPNDLNLILQSTKIKAIFTTGRMAEKLYNEFCIDQTNIPCIYLPSTSPANVAIKYEEILNSYKIILNYLTKI